MYQGQLVFQQVHFLIGKRVNLHQKKDKIEKIAEFFEINPDWLPGTSDFKTNKEIEEKPVRIIGKVIENRSKF